MKTQFDERSLKDLFERREALGWTVSDLLWFLEHPKISDWVRANPSRVEELMGDTTIKVSKSKPELVEKVSDWKGFFGKMRKDWRFSEINFPLGEDPGDKAEEIGFDREMTWGEVDEELKRLGRVGASLWALGRYLKENPDAQKEHYLYAIGTLFHETVGDHMLLFSYSQGYGNDVALRLLYSTFSPEHRFLVRKEKVGVS